MSLGAAEGFQRPVDRAAPLHRFPLLTGYISAGVRQGFFHWGGATSADPQRAVSPLDPSPAASAETETTMSEVLYSGNARHQIKLWGVSLTAWPVCEHQ